MPKFVFFLLFALAAFVQSAGLVCAQTYPNRSVRLVVAGPPGSGTDAVARLFAERLREQFGESVIVENKPGAEGIIAARYVAGSTPDGYTLLIGTPSHMSVNPILHANLSYDPVRDFVPLGTLSQPSMVLVIGRAVPATSVQELVDYAKAHPDELNYGSGASLFLLATEQFKSLTGIRMRHIPYNGLPPVVNALLAGDVQVALVGLSTSAPAIKVGRLRALAVMTRERDPLIPDVPTISESGVSGFNVPNWLGVFAPAGTPPAIAAQLDTAIAAAVADPEFRRRLHVVGHVAFATSGADLAANIGRETVQLRELARSAGMKVN